MNCAYCKIKLPHEDLMADHLSIHCAKAPDALKTMKLDSCPYQRISDLSLTSTASLSPVHKAAYHRTNSLRASMETKGVYYHEYLQLDKILGAQSLESEKHEDKAHDEHLFIVIHQTYELWFKQILVELDNVRALLMPGYVKERIIGQAVAGLNRISEIFRVINTQLTILETMTPLGFMDFRDYLFPASGFQSLQFRKIENTLGLLPTQRVQYGKRHYCTYLRTEHADECMLSEGEVSMHECIEKWLERTPFLEVGDFSFWKHYKEAVKQMKAQDEVHIHESIDIPEDEKVTMLEEINTRYKHYAIMYDKKEYDQLHAKGSIRLSMTAMQAALLIMQYQDEPIFQLPHKLLMHLFDIDQHLTQWRYRHASMVHRMIGSKMGTGGSSGYNYLRATASQHRIFKDLFQLPTFLIPRNGIPPLPDTVSQQMSFKTEK